MRKIPIVDLRLQYEDLKSELDNRFQRILHGGQFIMGNELKDLEKNLQDYLGVSHVLGCANGTDALQLAFMALELKAGDEIITPSFSYIAVAEVAALLGIKPVFVDVERSSFNIDTCQIEALINSKTKAIVPVHLFGRSANMDQVNKIAKEHNLFVIEDNAQSIGAEYYGEKDHGKTGSFSDIATLSFFPTKNLGCYGDGGAVITNNDELAERLNQLRSHGQSKKYIHKIIGINSRLDELQAAVLNCKLPKLDNYIDHRRNCANNYRNLLKDLEGIILPDEPKNSRHSYHQFTIRVKNLKRDSLKEYLQKNGISTMVYYPLPVHKQEAYSNFYKPGIDLRNSELLSSQVLSLPMHSHLKHEEIEYISKTIHRFYSSNQSR